MKAPSRRGAANTSLRRRLIGRSVAYKEKGRRACKTGVVDSGTALTLIVLVVLPVAAALFAGSFGLLEELGKGGLSTLDRAPTPPPTLPPRPASPMEREAEIRQLLQARRDRQIARGEHPLDLESEVSRLLEIDTNPAPAGSDDSALREEVRQLVIARNERRLGRGEPPLDVEAEIERQLQSI